jgi:hypothetical protein
MTMNSVGDFSKGGSHDWILVCKIINESSVWGKRIIVQLVVPHNKIETNWHKTKRKWKLYKTNEELKSTTTSYNIQLNYWQANRDVLIFLIKLMIPKRHQ